MAATDDLTRNYRRQALNLRAATLRDWRRLWPALDWTDLDRTFPAWLQAAVTLVQRDRLRVAGLASAYLRAHRMAAGLPGEVAVRMAAETPREHLETSLRVTTLVAAKKAAAAGQTLAQAKANTFVQSSGAASRLVLDGGRQTIRQTALADPRTEGWRRITSGGCDFCRMLAGRGAVYRSETVDFRSHDHCACTAEPVYR